MIDRWVFLAIVELFIVIVLHIMLLQALNQKRKSSSLK